MASKETPIIIFDGVCNLCNASVQFILRNERIPYFRFGTLQSEETQKLLELYANQDICDSVLLIEDGKLFQESTAALKIAKQLKHYWILYYLIFIPGWIRNPIYRLIARNRYKWFGRRDTCMMPTDELKTRFL